MAESKKSKIVVLVGATGYIGFQVLTELVDRGYLVICVGRNVKGRISECSGCVRTIDFDLSSSMCDLASLRKEIPSCDGVISCLGSRKGGIKDSWDTEFSANKNILNFAESVSCKVFILLSAICVQKPKLHFQKAKLAFEKELASSSVPYCIVRPTAYFKSLAGQIKNVKNGKPFILFDSGLNTACKPISKEDLAAYICDCLVNKNSLGKIIPIGGPGPAITPLEQSNLLFSKALLTKKVRRVPSWTLLLLKYCLSPLSIFSQKVADYREFLRIAYYYATESMLVWDPVEERYYDEKTPEFGNDRLEDFYEHMLKIMDEEISRVDAKLF